MERVLVSVDRLRRYNADASFEVYGDLGTGAIDWDHPLTPRPVRLWAEGVVRRGHVCDGHLVVRHLDSVHPDGHLEGAHVLHEHLFPALAVTFATPAYVFGRFQHAVTLVDGAGNVSPATQNSVTVNSAPSVPEAVVREAYDAGTDLLTWTFVGSRFDPMSGK